jgi:hypothetical protein
MIDNLQKQLIHIEHVVNQTNEVDDVQVLDQTYEVNQLKELTRLPSTSCFSIIANMKSLNKVLNTEPLFFIKILLVESTD